jgi:MtN3 and saliva related transmembrane protein
VTEMVGWVSSVILLLTISKQIHKQWREESSAGVSKWLFIGQVGASLGFTIYSWLLKNWVFVVTNALMLLSAFIGLGILLHQRRRASHKEAQSGAETTSLDEAAHS